MVIRKHFLQRVLHLLLVLTLAKGIFDAAQILTLIAENRPLYGDWKIYFTVGRGLLNGIPLYSGLFDLKPPGIFLLAALSLATTGNEALASVAYIASLLAIPLILFLHTFFMSRGGSTVKRSFFLICAALFGIVIMLYTEARNLPTQPEAFGVMFSLIYIITLFRKQHTFFWTFTVIRALALLGAIGFKEPFILTLLACALIYSKNIREFAKLFLIPLVFTALGGSFIMATHGWLEPYIHDYLPYIFSKRIAAETPLWIRGVRMKTLLAHLTAVHPLPLLIAPLTILQCCAPMSSSVLFKHKAAVQHLTLSALIISAAILLSFHLPSHLSFRHISLGSSVFFVVVSLYVFFLAAILYIAQGLAFLTAHRALAADLLPTITKMLVSLYLIVLAVNIADSPYLHHFVFAVPYYCILFMLFQQWAWSSKNSAYSHAILAACTLLAVITYSPGARYLQTLLTNPHGYDANIAQAQRFDALIKSCLITHYLPIWGAASITAYSQHSPMGPIFLRLIFMEDTYPPLRRTIEEGIHNAELIISQTQPGAKDLHKYRHMLERNGFSEEPPPCAQPYLPIKDHTLLFRAPA